LPAYPDLDRETINEDAENEKTASRRKTVEPIKSQLELLRALYLLKGTLKQIVERVESWASMEASAPLDYRLSRTPAAQTLVRDLLDWSWDAAGMLSECQNDKLRSEFRFLEDLRSMSPKECSEDGNPNVCASETTISDLNTLKFAARALFEIVHNIFENLLLGQSCLDDEYDKDNIAQYLKMADEELTYSLYGLGQILDNIGKGDPPGGISVAAKQAQTPPAGQKGFEQYCTK
jgi:hypothetical protein